MLQTAVADTYLTILPKDGKDGKDGSTIQTPMGTAKLVGNLGTYIEVALPEDVGTKEGMGEKLRKAQATVKKKNMKLGLVPIPALSSTGAPGVAGKEPELVRAGVRRGFNM